ncbi:sucrase ferredoxin [Corynebacterium tapiri]|uniref:Sucrase ferredoxin n=1 Tax=Corynebacterium tapiri TaxID=1448266 RepID=A0A5C4U3N4_9CORY|nr:sucrase ferredoxin [Corynebacterium tapiri]TNL97647.1 sucrase ferredoxin [Corynebacterium tapiri]
MTSTDSAQSAQASRCSDFAIEPLPGTAKTERVYVVFEHPNGWSHDVLDGDTFGSDLTAKIAAHLDGKAGLQLIRQPGREGRQVRRSHCFIVWAELAITELVWMNGPEEILNLDLSGPGKNDAEIVEHPLVLVCTHGKRDVCCAIKGRPLASSLHQAFCAHGGTDSVWETSHTKGHRFAPSVLLMPWGYSFGRLNYLAATDLVRRANKGEMFLASNRGRGIYDQHGQVTEIAVATQLAKVGETVYYGDLSVHGSVVEHRDGRRFVVETRSREVDGVLASCGKAPGVQTVVEATSVSEL